MDDGVGNSILCPKSNCDVIIDDEMVIDLVGDEEVKRRYQHLITNSFVQVSFLKYGSLIGYFGIDDHALN